MRLKMTNLNCLLAIRDLTEEITIENIVDTPKSTLELIRDQLILFKGVYILKGFNDLEALKKLDKKIALIKSYIESHNWDVDDAF